jgi:hypothetical protein
MNACSTAFVRSKQFLAEPPGPRLPYRGVLVLAALLWLPVLAGQSWSAGLTTGLLPVDEFGPADSRYMTAPNRLLIGPTIRLRLASGVGFEAGALRKGVDFDSISGRLGIGLTRYHTSAAAWQFPLLFHYGGKSRPVAPYFNVGMSLRRISGVNQKGENCTQLPTVVCTPFERAEAQELENATTSGVVLGGGLEFGVAFLRLSPEVRWTRWLSRPFTTPPASENQIEVLVRIAVPIAGSGRSGRR